VSTYGSLGQVEWGEKKKNKRKKLKGCKYKENRLEKKMYWLDRQNKLKVKIFPINMLDDWKRKWKEIGICKPFTLIKKISLTSKMKFFILFFLNAF